MEGRNILCSLRLSLYIYITLGDGLVGPSPGPADRANRLAG